jgi:IS30 family transposase
MGNSYNQLSLAERCTIAQLREAGQSIRKIAAALDRSPSTIAREIDTKSGKKIGYRADYAQEQTRAHRWKGSRLERDDDLRTHVLGQLEAGWSPEQIAGRMKLEAGHNVISHESIYRFIYAQIKRTNDHSWRRYLPRAKSKRGWRGRKGGSPAKTIPGRVSIAERPEIPRSQPGHWEGDLMLFSIYGQAILAAHDRSSRATFITRPPGKTSEPICDKLRAWLKPLPDKLRLSITFDNGTEFAQHQIIRKSGTTTFFCDPHSPWQKGGIENAIGRLRRFLPRKTNLDDLKPRHFLLAAQIYNNTPRKCLGFKTPAETFLDQLLHFECESTSQPSLG